VGRLAPDLQRQPQGAVGSGLGGDEVDRAFHRGDDRRGGSWVVSWSKTSEMRSMTCSAIAVMSSVLLGKYR
jgi:hypothetical protein